MKRFAARIATGLLTLIAAFLLSIWIGSSLPRNNDWREPASGVDIMVETNGVHTALVLPLVTPQKDWRLDFPVNDITAADQAYTHVAISWGEKDVFLNTPTWADLSAKTVLRILVIGGDGLLHVGHYANPTPSDDLRPLRISEAEYALLVKQIEKSVPPIKGRVRHHGYSSHDVFYDAPHRYTAINTCNQWTSDTLAAAGIRTGRWTPVQGGVMKWVPKPSARIGSDQL